MASTASDLLLVNRPDKIGCAATGRIIIALLNGVDGRPCRVVVAKPSLNAGDRIEVWRSDMQGDSYRAGEPGRIDAVDDRGHTTYVDGPLLAIAVFGL